MANFVVTGPASCAHHAPYRLPGRSTIEPYLIEKENMFLSYVNIVTIAKVAMWWLYDVMSVNENILLMILCGR